MAINDELREMLAGLENKNPPTTKKPPVDGMSLDELLGLIGGTAPSSAPQPMRIPKPEPLHIPEPEPIRIPEPKPVHIPEPEPLYIPEPEIPNFESGSINLPDIEENGEIFSEIADKIFSDNDNIETDTLEEYISENQSWHIETAEEFEENTVKEAVPEKKKGFFSVFKKKAAEEVSEEQEKQSDEYAEAVNNENIGDFSEEIANEITEPITEITDSFIAALSETADTSEVSGEITETAVNAEEETPETFIADKPKKGRSIVGALKNILDETPEKLAETKISEETVSSEIDVEIKTPGRFKKHLYFIAGLLFFAFAITGMVFAVSTGIDYFRNLNKVTDTKDDRFTACIIPAVVMDIEAFQDPSELSSNQVITAAIWRMIINGKDLDKYEKTFDIMSVPALEIEKSATELFGTSFSNIEHQTVGSGDVRFYYNPETATYNIPANPVIFSYYPDVTAYSETNGVFTLEVAYIREIPLWMNTKQEVAKVAKYRVQQSDEGFNILSVEIVSVTTLS